VDLNSGQQWAMYAWAAAVAIAVLAGIWFATNDRGTRSSLPLEHVAAATLLALFGWEMLVGLPASTMGLWALTAGLGEVRGVEGQQAFVLGQTVFVIGAAIAVVGILRRRRWGIALGVGLAAALVVWTVVNTLWLFVTLGASMSSDMHLGVATSAAGRGVPALVAIGLLAWPLVRRPTPRPTAPHAGRDWSSAPASDARP
jgi:hypothetical protein